MLTYTNLVCPSTVEEAYEEFYKVKAATLLGGCCWLRLRKSPIGKAVDLSGLGLRYIRETEEEILIGAMATLRDIETSPILQGFAGGAVSKAVQYILGIQFRECATIGGSVASKFGFSDILPTLLALSAEVEVYGKGRVCMKDYLACPREHELIVQIVIRKRPIRIAHEALRKSISDFPYLTGAVSWDDGKWLLVVGARPGVAVIAQNGSALMDSKGMDGLEEAVQAVTEEIGFQSNSHASAEYRKDMAAVVIRRLIKEVDQWK